MPEGARHFTSVHGEGVPWLNATAPWAIHGWDLARALNADDSLDVKLVESLYARLAPRIDALANTGNFQPPTGLPDTAPLQDKLLDLLGRRP